MVGNTLHFFKSVRFNCSLFLHQICIWNISNLITTICHCQCHYDYGCHCHYPCLCLIVHLLRICKFSTSSSFCRKGEIYAGLPKLDTEVAYLSSYLPAQQFSEVPGILNIKQKRIPVDSHNWVYCFGYCPSLWVFSNRYISGTGFASVMSVIGVEVLTPVGLRKT